MGKKFTIKYFISRLILAVLMISSLAILIPEYIFQNNLYKYYEYNEAQLISKNIYKEYDSEIFNIPMYSVKVIVSFEHNGVFYQKESGVSVDVDSYDDFIVYYAWDTSIDEFVGCSSNVELRNYNVQMYFCLCTITFSAIVLLFITRGFIIRVKNLKVEKKENDLDRIDAKENTIYQDYDDDVFEKYLKK